MCGVCSWSNGGGVAGGVGGVVAADLDCCLFSNLFFARLARRLLAFDIVNHFTPPLLPRSEASGTG